MFKHWKSKGKKLQERNVYTEFDRYTEHSERAILYLVVLIIIAVALLIFILNKGC